MSSWQEIEAEIRSSEALVVEQTTSGQDYDELCKATANAVCKLISHCRDLDTQSQTTINQAINAVVWTEGHRDRLCNALNNRREASTRKAQQGSKRPSQDCSAVELYLTDAEWDVIVDKNTPMSSKVATFKQRLRSLGIYVPSQTLKGRVANILRYKGLAAPDAMTPGEWKLHLNNVVNAVSPNAKVKEADFPFDYITEYPAHPNDLPAELYNSAYPGSSFPACRDVLALASAPMALRKNSRYYKVDTPPNTHVINTADISNARPVMENMFRIVVLFCFCALFVFLRPALHVFWFALCFNRASRFVSRLCFKLRGAPYRMFMNMCGGDSTWRNMGESSSSAWRGTEHRHTDIDLQFTTPRTSQSMRRDVQRPSPSPSPSSARGVIKLELSDSDAEKAESDAEKNIQELCYLRCACARAQASDIASAKSNVRASHVRPPQDNNTGIARR